MVGLENALAHRIAIGRRFGARIADGDAVFLAPVQGGIAAPRTVHEGEARLLSGLNRLMLMQVMQDRNWSDARFFTSDQVEKNGWVVRNGAKPIGLQYLVAVDAAGSVSQNPVVKRFHVFNASDVDGAEPVSSVGATAAVEVADVLAAIAAAGVPGSGGEVGPAVGAWARSVYDQREGAGGSSLSELDVLGVRVASALVLSEIGLQANVADPSTLRAEWAALIEADPLAFCEAVNVAQVIASAMVADVRVATVERLSLASVKRSTVAVSPRVEGLFREKGSQVLVVPFAEKDAARALGALWHPGDGVWFAPKGLDLGPFDKWMPGSVRLNPTITREVQLESFRAEMVLLGLKPPKEILDDGKWHNVETTTKAGKNRSGAYIVDLKGGRYGQPLGTINNKLTGQSFTWTHAGTSQTPEQRAKALAESMTRAAVAEADALRAQDVAAEHAAEIWASGAPALGHGYVTKKGIEPNGLRQVPGAVLLSYPEFVGDGGRSAIRSQLQYLIVPMHNKDGELRAIQAISPDGAVKTFMRGAQKQGTMLLLGDGSMADLIAGRLGKAVAFGEGVATMASFRAVSGLPVVACFDAGNLEVVAASVIADLHEAMTPILALDNDQFHLERALGFLADKCGVNPLASGADSESLLVDSSGGLRPVRLGSVVMDGQWQDAPGGKYCAHAEVIEGAVRSVSVSVVGEAGEHVVTASFRNRGDEAGRKLVELCSEFGRDVFCATPVFKKLDMRPTDWNDLVMGEGIAAAQVVLAKVLPRDFIPAMDQARLAPEPLRARVTVVQRPAAVER